MKYILIALLLFPLVSSAHGFHSYVESIIVFINRVLIPFILGLAFLFFAINVIRFFVIEGSNENGREKAKNLAIYGVMAFVIILIFWGALSVLANGTGLGGHGAPTPDYLEKNGAELQSPARPAAAPATGPAPTCVDNNGNPRPC